MALKDLKVSLWGAALLAALCMLLPSTTQAHSLYIQSSRYHVSEGKKSPLFFCYGHRIPVDDGVRAKKLKSVRVQAPSGEVQEISIREETCLQSYMVDYEKAGTYVLSAETNPGYYTVYIDKKGRKRHTIKSMSAVAGQAREIKKSLFSKQYSKTYVVCENPSETFPARIGLGLELVPAKDITALKAGETLELKVFFKGRPYEGPGFWDATYNGFSTEPEDLYYPRREVGGGTVKIFIPRPGRWFVRYFIKTEATGQDRERYLKEKNTATLVFQIPKPRKRPKSSGH